MIPDPSLHPFDGVQRDLSYGPTKTVPVHHESRDCTVSIGPVVKKGIEESLLPCEGDGLDLTGHILQQDAGKDFLYSLPPPPGDDTWHSG